MYVSIFFNIFIFFITPLFSAENNLALYVPAQSNAAANFSGLTYNESKRNNTVWHIDEPKSLSLPFIKEFSAPLERNVIKISRTSPGVGCTPQTIWIWGTHNDLKVTIEISNFSASFINVEENIFGKYKSDMISGFNHNQVENLAYLQSPLMSTLLPKNSEVEKFFAFALKNKIIPYDSFQVISDYYSPRVVKFLKDISAVQQYTFFPKEDTPVSEAEYTQRILEYLEYLEKIRVIKNFEKKIKVLLKVMKNLYDTAKIENLIPLRSLEQERVYHRNRTILMKLDAHLADIIDDDPLVIYNLPEIFEKVQKQLLEINVTACLSPHTGRGRIDVHKKRSLTNLSHIASVSEGTEVPALAIQANLLGVSQKIMPYSLKQLKPTAKNVADLVATLHELIKQKEHLKKQNNEQKTHIAILQKKNGLLTQKSAILNQEDRNSPRLRSDTFETIPAKKLKPNPFNLNN